MTHDYRFIAGMGGPSSPSTTFVHCRRCGTLKVSRQPSGNALSGTTYYPRHQGMTHDEPSCSRGVGEWLRSIVRRQPIKVTA